MTASEWKIVGTVIEKFDAGRYTYVKLDTGEGPVWAAGPRVEVAAGDTVSIPDGLQMTDFFSESLDRRFDRIHLVASMKVEPANPSAHAAKPTPAASESKAVGDVSGIERAAGGKTLREIFEGKDGLAGETVTLRGKVVKSLRGILGKNWIHLQDGTEGPGGVYDLVVTTQGTAEVGDLVLVTGTVAVDRDLGYGYKYEVLIEDARVTVE
ncbi:MAG: nucleotide-binding protein [Deltaproteobacteria bacterium]|nr:nucleotide-binding protein [Deltaproteobacteria bacterium]